MLLWASSGNTRTISWLANSVVRSEMLHSHFAKCPRARYTAAWLLPEETNDIKDIGEMFDPHHLLHLPEKPLPASSSARTRTPSAPPEFAVVALAFHLDLHPIRNVWGVERGAKERAD